MVRCGKIFALRSLLLATALSFAGSEPSWSLGGGGGGSPPPAVLGITNPNVNQQATNNLLTLGNSFTWMFGQTIATQSITSTGLWMTGNAQEFTALYTSNPGLISQTVRAATPAAAGLL